MISDIKPEQSNWTNADLIVLTGSVCVRRNQKSRKPTVSFARCSTWRWLSWYGQPSRRSLLEQSMFCRLLKTANVGLQYRPVRTVLFNNRLHFAEISLVKVCTVCFLNFNTKFCIFFQIKGQIKNNTVCLSAHTGWLKHGLFSQLVSTKTRGMATFLLILLLTSAHS